MNLQPGWISFVGPHVLLRRRDKSVMCCPSQGVSEDTKIDNENAPNEVPPTPITSYKLT